MEKMLDLVSPITAEHDDKLNQLKARLAEEPIAGHKRLIFTQYADTARYLYDNLNPGERRPEVEVIYGTDRARRASSAASRQRPIRSFINDPAIARSSC